MKLPFPTNPPIDASFYLDDQIQILDLDFSDLLHYCKAYLSEIENFFEQESKTLREESKEIYRAQSEKHPLSALSKWERDFANQQKLERLENLFPGILRISLFVIIYSAVERELKRKCKELQKSKHVPIAVDDLRNSNLDGVWMYLTKLAGITTPPKAEWDQWQDYEKLRNCLVHCHGRVDDSRDEKRLRAFISNHQFLKLFDESVVSLNKGFCEEVIKNAVLLFKKLDEASIR